MCVCVCVCVCVSVCVWMDGEWIYFIDFLKAVSEIKYLTSFGTFFQSWLVLRAMLSKPNFFVLGFWDSNIGKFFRFYPSLIMVFIISGDGSFKYI